MCVTCFVCFLQDATKYFGVVMLRDTGEGDADFVKLKGPGDGKRMGTCLVAVMFLDIILFLLFLCSAEAEAEPPADFEWTMTD